VESYGIYAQQFDKNRVKTGEGGGFVITWTSGKYDDTVAGTQDGSDYGVFGQQYDARGNTIGDEFQLNSTATGHQDEPHIAALEDGRFMVVWESDGDSWSIYGQRYISNGIADISLLTREKASYAISVIDSAIDQVGHVRSKLGALQNRLGHYDEHVGQYRRCPVCYC
jgi:flagellin-like hook-associated protein FlgL